MLKKKAREIDEFEALDAAEEQKFVKSKQNPVTRNLNILKNDKILQ